MDDALHGQGTDEGARERSRPPKLLIFTGYSGFTQRTDNVARLIQQDYGAGIDCLVFGEDNDRHLRSSSKARYGRVVCVEHLLKSCPALEVSGEELAAIERELGHSLTHLAYAERYFVQHTHSLPAARALSQDEIIAQVVNLYRHIVDLLDGVDLAIVYTCASIESELLYYACRSRGIRFLTFNEQRIGYRWSVVANNMDVHDDALALYRDPAFRPTQTGRRRVKAYRERLLAGRKNKVETDYQTGRVAAKRLTPGNLWRFLGRLARNDDPMFLAPSRRQRVEQNLRLKLRQRYISRVPQRRLPERPFVYFPLSMVPEASTLIRGLPHYDQLSLVRQLSLQLPLDRVLAVREHPSMIGYNPVGFYQELRKIFNVRLLSPAIDPTKCILASEAVVTVTGTSGIEALALGKKTVALGTCIYSDLESVFHCPDVMRVGEILRRPWTEEDRARQEEDLVRFASALDSAPGFDDPDNVLWTREAFDPQEMIVDRNIVEALRPHLDALTGHRGRCAASRAS